MNYSELSIIWIILENPFACFAPCEDGASTFFYKGDVRELLDLFGLEVEIGECTKRLHLCIFNRKNCNGCFRLNGEQYDQVFPHFCMTDGKMQQAHRSKELFMVILVDDASSVPSISNVVVNPFDLWHHRKLNFYTESLVVELEKRD